VTTEERYFRYHFRETLPRLAITIVLALIFCSDPLLDLGVGKYLFDFNYILYTASMMALCMPVFEFRMFNNRRNLDTWFSLPIDRWKLALVHLLTGVMHIAIVLAILFLFAVSYVGKNGGGAWGWLLLYYIVMVLLTSLSFGFFSFVFLQANSTGDGCLFIMDYAMLPTVFEAFFDRVSLNGGPVILGINGVISDVTQLFEDRILTYSSGGSWIWNSALTKAEPATFFFYLVLDVLICVGAIYLLFRSFNRRRSEKVEDVSDSWFGYRTLIPVIAVAMLQPVRNPTLVLLRLIMMYVAYIIYRRGVRLKHSDYIIMIIYGILLLLML
jgi:hypothetical protein